MAGPWEKYAPQDGPWTKYGGNSESSTDPVGPTKAAAASENMAAVESGGRSVVKEVNGGIVYRNSDGSLGFTSPGYSTTDRDVIVEMLQGQMPADAWQKEIDQERMASHPIATRANEFIRGVPFVGSHTDDLVGMVSPQAGAEMRRSTETMRREHPGQTAALNVAGGIAGSIPLAIAAAPAVGAAAPAAPLARAGAGLVAGATAGGIEGAVWGAGEGRTAKERLSSAGQHGALGAIFGGVLGAALPLAGDFFEAAVRRYRGEDISRIAKEFGVSRQTAKALKVAFEANDQDAAARIMRAGPDATLADAGRSGQALLDAAAARGGKPLTIVDNAVQDRAAGALRVVNSELDSALGPPRGPIGAAREIATTTRPARKAAYDAAFATPISYADDTGRAVEGVLSRIPRKTLNTAVERANDMMRADGVRNMQILFDMDTGKFMEMPNVQQLDQIKRALDGIAREAVDNFGRPTDLGNMYSGLARRLRDATVDATGGKEGTYARALAEGQGKISMDTGLQLGLDMLRGTQTTREVFRETFTELPKDAREMVKVGLRSHIDDTLARVKMVASDPNADAREAMAALKMLTTRDAETKLRVLLGPDAPNLVSQMRRAQASLEMRASVARNSATAIRGVAHGGVDDIMAPGMVGSLARGEPVNATRRLTQTLLATTPADDAAKTQAVWEEIATVLSQRRGSKGATKALEFVEQALAGQPLSDAQNKLVVNQFMTALTLSGAQAGRQLLAKP